MMVNVLPITVLGGEAKQGAVGAVARGVVETVKSVGAGIKAAPKGTERLHCAHEHVRRAFEDNRVQRRKCLL